MLHIFSFLFGVFSVIVCGIYLLIRFLETLETKTEREFKDILAQAAKERAERRYDTSRYSSEKRGKICIKTPENSSVESPEWSHCVLKNNMLFMFKQPTDTSAVGVICFDGCSLSIIRNKTSKFHKKNGIAILHPERDLLYHSKILHFYFDNGKELETWYWYLKEAASLTVKKTPEEESEAKLCQQFFTDLPIRACVPSATLQQSGNMCLSTAPNYSNGLSGGISSGSLHKRTSSTGNSSPLPINKDSIEMMELLSPSSASSFSSGLLSSDQSKSVIRDRKSSSFTRDSSSPSSSSNISTSSPNQIINNSNISSSGNITSISGNNSIQNNNNNNNNNSTYNNTTNNLNSNQSNATVQGISQEISASKFDWLNVLLGRVFFNIYNSEELLAFASSKIIKKLNKLKKPSILKSITLQNLDFGPNMPILQDAKLLFITPQGELSVDLLLKYHGGFTLTIKIEVMISFRGHSVTIPFVISVTVKSLSGRMNIQCLPPPTKRFWVGFYGEPECEIDIDTSIGQSKTSYLNMPKVAKIIVNKLKAELFEMMVLPNTDDWPLPSAKHKKKSQQNNSIPTPSPVDPAKN